jgi:ADP-heptose:LPS heptosyltransferase/GT2 family glycosyltransferase
MGAEASAVRLLGATSRTVRDLARGGQHRHRVIAQLRALAQRALWSARRRRWNARGRRVVAIGLVDHLGDVVAAEPIVRALRREHPDDVLVWFVRRPWRALLARHPELDRVATVRCLTEWMFLAQDAPFDRVVDLHVRGRACDACYWPLARPDAPADLDLGNYYRDGGLLDAFCRTAGMAPLEPADAAPRLASDPRAARAVDRLGLPAAFVVVHAEARQPERCWTPERWRELGARLVDEHGVAVVEVGLQPLGCAHPRWRDLTGRLSVAEMAEVLRRARLFVGVDSGPAHIGNAVGTPGVVLLGRYRSYARYLPYSGGYADGSNAAVIHAEDAAATIPVEHVLAAARRFLAPAEHASPLVSVVIPTHAHADLLPATLRSVAAQTEVECEVIVVDDGSRDATRAVLEPWIRARAIRYVRQEHAGQAAARNRGLAAARGAFVCFLDDDDLLPPGVLARHADVLRRHPEAVLVHGTHATLRDGVVRPPQPLVHPGGWCHSAYLARNWLQSPGQALVRRSTLARLGTAFDPSLSGSDDWDLWLRLALLGPFRPLREVALMHRIHARNASRGAVEHARAHLRVMDRHLGRDPLRRCAHLHRAAAYFVPNLVGSAARARSAGDHRAALVAYLHSLRFRPALLARPRFLVSFTASLLGIPSRR